MRSLVIFFMLFCTFVACTLSFYYYLIFKVYNSDKYRYSSTNVPVSVSRDNYYSELQDDNYDTIQGQLVHYNVNSSQLMNQSLAVTKGESMRRLNCPTNILKMASRLRAHMNYNSSDRSMQIHHLKACITLELKRRQIQATNVLYYPRVATDTYGIKSKVSREKIYTPSLDRLCRVKFNTVDRRSFTINIMSTDLIRYLPSESVTSAIISVMRRENQKRSESSNINTDVNKDATQSDDISCALVSSAGSLVDSKLGEQIDSHDLVLRFNDAPSGGVYAQDVGSKTTVRIVNSKLLTSKSFNITSLSGSVFLTWDPFQYVFPFRMHPVSTALKSDFAIIETYKAIRAQNPHIPLYMIDPYTVWRLYDELSMTTMKALPRTPPTSGFIGISLLLNICSYVHVYEYLPSMRLSELCHYYSDASKAESKSLGCTFGDWHPTATEKLYTLAINSATDEQLIVNGTAFLESCER